MAQRSEGDVLDSVTFRPSKSGLRPWGRPFTRRDPTCFEVDCTTLFARRPVAGPPSPARPTARARKPRRRRRSAPGQGAATTPGSRQSDRPRRGSDSVPQKALGIRPSRALSAAAPALPPAGFADAVLHRTIGSLDSRQVAEGNTARVQRTDLAPDPREGPDAVEQVDRCRAEPAAFADTRERSTKHAKQLD